MSTTCLPTVCALVATRSQYSWGPLSELVWTGLQWWSQDVLAGGLGSIKTSDMETPPLRLYRVVWCILGNGHGDLSFLMDKQTHANENITFPKLHCRVVIIEWHPSSGKYLVCPCFKMKKKIIGEKKV